MFTTSGIGIIPKDCKVEERQAPSGAFFSFQLITKDPYKEGRHYVNVSLFVPTEYIERARDSIKPGVVVQVRIGEINGRRSEKSNYVFMTVNTRWKWIEVLKVLPGNERKKDI